MKLLFITRKYPPMVGGMEKLSYALAKEFKKNVDTTLIKWGGSQKFLPVILPLFLIKALYLIPSKKIDHIHIGDGLLSPIGLILKVIFGIKTTITIVGLDVTFNFPGYQFIVTKCISRMDKIICISQATMDECTKRGIPKEKCVVIPLGVYPEDFQIKAERGDLNKIVGHDLEKFKVLITVGRLVKRKGVSWFVENVMTNLENNIVYLIIGSGPEREKIMNLIHKYKLTERVFVLGKVDDHNLKTIYNTADLFVMPNIKLKGTIEGFGLVAVEASSTGLPVLASKLEGIKAAVVENKTGKLVESMNASEFTKNVKSTINFDRMMVRRYARENYSWQTVGDVYLKTFK